MDFEQLYKAYYMQVYSYIITMTKDPTEAEEITQKAFFKAFLSKSKYRGDSSPFTWLCAIAKNIFMDKKRVEKRQADTFENSLEETPSDDSLEKNFEDQEQVFRIHQILHQMDEPYKEVFQLRVFGELSFAQIGQLFGKTESWARVTYHRAKIRIKDGMEEEK